MGSEAKLGCAIVGVIVGIIAVIIGLSMYLGPIYQVWSSGMTGQAELAQADYNRQVQVVNAQANVQAQTYNAQAEVARAKGLAQANNIVKSSISPEYIAYLQAQAMAQHTQGATIIYVPTEANLPITEASRVSGAKP